MAYTKEQREANQRKKEELEQESQKQEEKESIIEKKKKEISIRNLPLSTEVYVSNNCHNGLIYISRGRTGFETSWDYFGNPQPMTLEELLIMRNTQRKFFERPWIRIEGFVDEDYNELFSVEEILDFLQVKKYYSKILCPPNIDDIFKLSPAEIEERVPKMSKGTKANIVVRANTLIESGQLDSLRVIATLEKVLNCELSRPKL